jgi:hypothetical protein
MFSGSQDIKWASWWASRHKKTESPLGSVGYLVFMAEKQGFTALNS